MKKLLSVTAIMAALAAVPVFAAPVSTVRATIPFEFNVSGVTLPAGDYEVVDGVARETLTIRTIDGKHSATFITYAQDAKLKGDSPSLSFHNVNGKRYLAGVTRAANARRLGGSSGESSVVRAGFLAKR